MALQNIPDTTTWSAAAAKINSNFDLCSTNENLNPLQIDKVVFLGASISREIAEDHANVIDHCARR
jgi:hypothetical protein